MSKHWVVLAEWCVDYEAGHHIVGVFHSKKEAIDCLRHRVNIDDRLLAEEYGYEIYEDTDTNFDSGKEGYYIHDHIAVSVIEVKDMSTNMEV